MTEVTCVALGCSQPPAKSRKGMCAKHYRDAWKQQHSCAVPGCTGSYLAKGLCSLHYHRDQAGISFAVPVLGSGKAAGCAVNGCTEPYHANGYCSVHAQRQRRTGDPLGVLRETRDTCTVPGCGEKHFGLGCCAYHYKRHLRYGAPEPVFCCKECGAEIDRRRGTGSYFYCGECHVRLPAGYRAKRLERLAENNASMTAADWELSGDYLSIIRLDPCVYCGAPSTAVDHIRPVVDGGSDRWDNLAPVCKVCNSTKRAGTVLGVMLVRLESRPDEPGAHHKAA